ncbi:zinc finger BED domain-containing protein 4-like [Rana temporaria]|uniref:zinc finger BED domain-containing protein 4-like n=1 Tax=Rana temporaria TaxID=8407 RepID=UPI001AAC4A7B|nr:zinc finger BED domain-containing protein 4-like [Rana temporaria]
MLRRSLDMKEAIIATLALVNANLPTLTLDEWEVIKNACDLLKPFEEVTMEISADRSVTASKVILMARGLQKVVQKFCGADEASKSVTAAAARIGSITHGNHPQAGLGDPPAPPPV